MVHFSGTVHVALAYVCTAVDPDVAEHLEHFFGDEQVAAMEKLCPLAAVRTLLSAVHLEQLYYYRYDEHTHNGLTIRGIAPKCAYG